MELRPHQINALENVNEIFEENNRAIVVHPTGVGKTYIALGLFEQNKDKKLTFVSPSTAILWQLKLKIAREYGVGPEEYNKVFPNLELTTYQQINADVKKSETYIKDFESDYVVYDEAHHIAENKWGKTAKEIMAEHPEIKFLGLTATPERTDGIDVVKEVFDGNLADEITLEEAVATRLLKMPDYVNAIYSYKPIIEELEERIDALEEIDPEKYIMLKKDMEKAKNALEKADGMPEIFAKHIKEKDGRYIVFCKDIEHLKQMVEASKTQGWFEGVSDKVETLEIHSEEDELTNKKILKRFESDNEATKDTLRVLFSVAKINEGLHLDNLSGVIMLRPTKSKIVFRQQLGRAMSISEDAKQTTAFDIVNNIDSFQDMHDFMEQVIQIRIQNNPDKSPEEIRKEVQEEFNITDETREVSEILRKVAGGLEAEWEEFYQRSVKWREVHEGRAPKGGNNNKEEHAIYTWERRQILKYLKEYQDLNEQEIPEEYKWKVTKLKQLGLRHEMKIQIIPERRFEEWKKWTLEHEITPSTKSSDEKERNLAVNMNNDFAKMKKNPDKYKIILQEYEMLKKQYGRNRIPEIVFERWKQWTLEHEITPSMYAEDDKEKKCACDMRYAFTTMKKNPTKYKTLLEEYEKIFVKYSRYKNRKSKEQTFEEWKKWTLEHEITPSAASSDENERKLADRMVAVYSEMKREPDRYKAIIEEYDDIYARYSRKKSKEQTFEEWKQWTLEHEITPKRKSSDETERKLADRMGAVYSETKREPDRYKAMIEEYDRLYAQYGRGKDRKKQEETFAEWKEWTLANKKVPSVKLAQNEEEKHIAIRMGNALYRMRANFSKYQIELEEYEKIYTQYGTKKLKGLQKQKQDAISEVRELKGQVEQAEELYNRTQEAIDKAIEDKAKTVEGPGE